MSTDKTSFAVHAGAKSDDRQRARGTDSDDDFEGELHSKIVFQKFCGESKMDDEQVVWFVFVAETNHRKFRKSSRERRKKKSPQKDLKV